MSTVTRLMTAEELEARDSDMRCELLNGILIEMPPADMEHGGIAVTVGALLDSHVRPRGLGYVSVLVGFILGRNPDTVRAPDIAFIRADKMPDGPLRTFPEFAPDLAVEIASHTTPDIDVLLKVHDWIGAGTALVWVIYPSTRTVTVVRSLLDREELTEDDTLDGGSVLPGFTCRVADLFA